MWKAILIVCTISSEHCFIIEDAFGPYESKEKCQERVVYMFMDFKQIIKPPYKEVIYHCKTDFEVT